jgi:predicted phage tail protein
MPVKVRYIPVLFDKESWIEFESRNHSLVSILLSLVRKYPGIRKDSPNITIRINGKNIHPLAWQNMKVHDGDEVTIIQEPGYVFSAVLTVIGTIGSIVGTAGAGATVGGGLATLGVVGATATTIGTILTILDIVLVIASIAFSIYSIASAPSPDRAKGAPNSPTYGWDGVKTTMQQGGTVPVIYGEHLVGGTIIECFVTSDGDNNFLNMLVALGEGEISGIVKQDLTNVCIANTDIPYMRIDGNYISNFGVQGSSWWWDYRLGLDDQPIIPGFTNINIVYNSPGSPDIGPYSNQPYFIYTTVDNDVQGFELRTRCPSLVAQWQGNYYPIDMYFNVYHRVYGTTDWISDGQHYFRGWSTTPVRRYFRKDGLAPAQYDIKIEFDHSFPAPFPIIPMNTYLDDVVEIKYDTVAYNGTAFVGLKFLATDKMSGQTPSVTFRVRGKKVLNLKTQVYEWSHNPIYCVYDMLVNKRYGLGYYIDVDSIDVDQLIEAAEYCDEQVGDGNTRAIDSVDTHSLTCGSSDYTFLTSDVGRTICCTSPTDSRRYTRMIITSIGTHIAGSAAGWDSGLPTTPGNWEFGEPRFRLDLVIDTSDNALNQIATMCASFRCAPLWTKNCIQLIIDKPETPGYLFNMGNIIAGSFKHTFGSEKQKPNVMDLDFANQNNYYTREEREVDDQEAYILSKPRHVRKISMLGATRESQIYREGRFHLRAAQLQDQSISFNAMIDAIPCLPGDLIKFQHDVNAWGKGGRVMASTINSITLDQEVEVVAGKTYVVTVRQPGAVSGTEMLETRIVSNTAGFYNVLNTTVDFSSVPAIFSPYAFGETDIEAVPFRITRLTANPNNEVSVEASLYDSNCYSDTGIVLPEPVYSTLPNPNLVESVTNLAVSEGGIVLADGTWIPYLELGFQIPSESLAWAYGEVWISISQDEFVTETKQFYGKATSSIGYRIENSGYLAVGSTVRVRVVSVNKAGKKYDYNTSPYVDVLITGKVTAPSDVINFVVVQQTDKLVFTWDNILDRDINFFEIREGSSWNLSTLIAKAYGTNYTDFVFSGGLNNYLIKAVDRSGNYSENPAQFQLTVIASSLQNVVADLDVLGDPKVFDPIRTKNALLHFNGANDSVGVADEYGNTWVVGGGGKLSTTSPKFGTAKFLQAAGGSLGTSIFTSLGAKFSLEIWWNTSDNTAQNQNIFYIVNGSGHGLILQYNNAGDKKLHLIASSNGTSWDIANWVAGTKNDWANGTWYNIIVDYDGAVYRIYQGTTDPLTLDISVASALPICPITNLYLAGDVVGSIDETRITLGQNRYGSVTPIAGVSEFVKDGTVVQYGAKGYTKSVSLSPSRGWDDNHVWTAHGNAQIDTAQKYAGSGSGLFDGTGDYISTPNSEDFNFGTGDFTVSFHVRFHSLSSTQNFLAYQTSEGAVQFYITAANHLTIWGQTGNVLVTSGETINVNTWYKVDFVRSGNDWNIYIDDVSYASATDTRSLGMPINANGITIGSECTGPTQFLDGWIDEMAIYKGSKIISLLHMDGDDASPVFTDDAKTWDYSGELWDLPIDPTTGYFLSSIIDVGSVASWSALITDTYIPDGDGQTVSIEINTSNDGSIWSGWVAYAAGEYTARYFQFKVTLATDNENENIWVTKFQIQIGSTKLTTMRFTNQAILITGTTVPYGHTFATTPSIQVTPIGSSFASPVISAQNTTQCTVWLYDANGSAIAGNVNISIEGF